METKNAMKKGAADSPSNVSKKIFISYSRGDKERVFRIKNEIDNYVGMHTCWLDITGIESDKQFIDVIINAIDESEIFLFMYSKKSENSNWTRKEVEYAQNKGKRIVFVKLEDIELSNYYLFQFGSHDIIKIQDKDEKQKLLRDLRLWLTAETDDNTEPIAISKKGDAMLKSVGTYKWHILMTAVFFVLGYACVGWRNRSFCENNMDFSDTTCIDSCTVNNMWADHNLESELEVPGKDSTEIMKAKLEDFLFKTDSICVMAQDKKGDKHIINALRDANWYYYYHAKYLTKRLYGKDIERNKKLDALVSREHNYWIEEANKIGKNKANYARKKQYYENAYRLRETDRLKSQIDWLDARLNERRN